MQLSLGGKRLKFKPLSTVVLLVVSAVLWSLAVWQWQRAEQKLQIVSQLQLNELDKLPMHLALQAAAQVATGVQSSVDISSWQANYWWLDNQVVDGKLGFDLIAVANTAQGVFAINLGFIESGARTRVAPPALPELPVGRFNVWLKPIAASVAGWRQSAQEFPHLVAELATADMQASGANSHMQLVLVDSTVPFQTHYQPYVMSPEKHQAYALQWALLAIAALVVWLVAAISRSNDGE